MGRSLSRRAEAMVQSDIRTMSIECDRHGGINLAQGVCDTEVPALIRQAAADGIERGINSYTRFDGLAELRQAIARKLARDNGIVVDPESQVTVSAGSTGAFYCACLALLNPGDEVILFEPFYGYHLNTLVAAEAVPAYVTLRRPDWTFAASDLEAALTPRTKGILVNTPANPSGKVFTPAELEDTAAFAERHDLFVFTDEIYEHFVYEGGAHVSPGALPGMAERTITISGFSKVFSITGWRIGYSACDERWAQMIGYVNDLVYVCAPAPLQFAVSVGLAELGGGFYDELRSTYVDKRDRLCKALRGAALTPCVPQGAYYVLADVSRLPGATSKAKAMHLLETVGVAGVPGDAFFHGADGRNLIRFCFAKPDAELDEACRRISRLV